MPFNFCGIFHMSRVNETLKNWEITEFRFIILRASKTNSWKSSHFLSSTVGSLNIQRFSAGLAVESPPCFILIYMFTVFGALTSKKSFMRTE